MADFGTARMKTKMGEETTISVTGLQQPGTPYYQAPEIQVDELQAQPSSDVWSLSLVLVELFTGRRPWDKSHPQYIMKKLFSREMPDRLKDVPEIVKPIFEAGLNYNREKRPSANEMEKQFADIVKRNCMYPVTVNDLANFFRMCLGCIK